MTDPIKLLLVDDSKLIRAGISAVVRKMGGEVVVIGQAENGEQGLELARELQPDVIMCDVEMPVMDGLTMLKHLMISNPKPVIMLSTLTYMGSSTTFDALRYGAVDFAHKPNPQDDRSPDDFADEIFRKVKMAASVEVSTMRYIRRSEEHRDESIAVDRICQKVVAIGAAEGGYGPLLKIIPALSMEPNAAYLVVLYSAPEQMDNFARYLNEYSRIPVKCAQHGETVHPGVCYICSGNDYMTLHNEGNGLALHVGPAPFSFRQGSIDMLLFSVADLLTTDSVGVILSGMGSDGAEGLREVEEMGGVTLVQDPGTCLFKEKVDIVSGTCTADYIVADNEIVGMLAQVL